MINAKIDMSKYPYEKLRIVYPSFESNLTDLILDLNHLRRKRLMGSTHPRIFFQLKRIFHMMESLGSARIEGNHTTIAEFIETKIAQPKPQAKDEKMHEIENIESSMDFIEKVVEDTPIDDAFLRELHKKVVSGLSPNAEGDYNPGQYRKKNIVISGASHIPPDYTQVNDYMQELTSFINTELPHKYDLLKIALVHHRFVWIHPFQNGNGRTVRLITYAQLVKSDFKVKRGRIINPTAIFCSNREKYYNLLSKADSGTSQDLLEWCDYVLTGLIREIEKIDKLLDYKYLSDKILLPAVKFSLERKVITQMEADILNVAVKKETFQAHDLKNIFPNKSAIYVSRQIKRLKNKHMISAESARSRKYLIDFGNNYLLRGVIKMLDQCGFLPLKGEAS